MSPLFMVTTNDPPYVTPSLTANLIVRVILGIIANLVCLVPLRLLYRNGEFAAVVFIIVVEIKNIFTILMALIWRTDDMESWWPGYGLCDVQQFVSGILRANPLTVREKRRRNFIQALIIFPLPIVQLAFTWPLAAQRYMVGTLMGCSWVPSSTWPYLLFFVIAELVMSVVAAIYAVITFFRFRQVSKITSSALTSNRTAFLRSQRAKRRLYLMVMSILVPFLPITVTLCVLNVRALGSLEPFDFNQIHHSTTSLIPWGAIIFVPSRLIDFGSFNNGYISILTAIPIFLFFGMTKDAMNSYRLILLWFGLGKFWPGLYIEYDPDRKAMQTSTSAGLFTCTTGKTKSDHGSSRYKLTTQITVKSTSSGESTAGSSNHTLTRLLTPRLATSLSERSNSDPSIPPPPPSWASRLPRNPFPFLNKTTPVHLASSIPSQPPVLPALSTKASVFSLHSQNDDDIFLQPVVSRRQRSPPPVASFAPPPVPVGQPHPSEALDLPNAFSTLESSSRSVRFADSTSSEAGEYHAR
ncbi:hypothetical protein NLG97_g4252 [Lecanicillium saksenae]|uniref:Uncharacterized protein n=1 Tax=Lecanicillium saksenae TaxID=468837 RepID=A0ACC1QZ37_9HYPO|nr:hypothetical protein NLG97_g4252 [Lecanicillium saksenae]